MPREFAIGGTEPTWWFGFDCSHLGDASPAYARLYSSLAHGTYRTVDYVKREIAVLAKQLANAA